MLNPVALLEKCGHRSCAPSSQDSVRLSQGSGNRRNSPSIKRWVGILSSVSGVIAKILIAAAAVSPNGR
jgi:hypothetical protein